nr:type II secretion system protein N [Sphingomicrobium lutaoense]
MTARQVAGTVWSGRVGEMMAGPERLGTFDVALNPLTLPLGRFEVAIERLDDPEGPLTGVLALGGASEGVKDLNGRMTLSRLLSPLPSGAMRFEDVRMLFKGGRCREAAGSVQLQASLGIAGLSRDMSGPVSCREDGRGMAELKGPRGAERLTIIVDAEGGYEADLAIEGAPPILRDALSRAGFAEEGTSVVLRQSGRLR